MSWRETQLKKLKHSLVSLTFVFAGAAWAGAQEPAKQSDKTKPKISQLFEINYQDTVSNQQFSSKLNDFVKRGDIQSLRKHLEAGYDANSIGHNQDTPLITLFKNWKRLANNPARENIFHLLIKHGGDLTQENKYGMNAVGAAFDNLSGFQYHKSRDPLKAIKTIQSAFDVIDYLHQNPQTILSIFDIGIIHKTQLRGSAAHITHKAHTDLIKTLVKGGLDVNKVYNRKSDKTLAHGAAAFNNTSLLSYLQKQGFTQWSRSTTLGANAADYAYSVGADKAQKWLQKKNIIPNIKQIAKANIVADFDYLTDTYDYAVLLKPKMSAAEIKQSFHMFPILKPPPYGTGKTPVLAVSEHTLLGRIFSPFHMHDTYRSADGTMDRLSGGKTDAKIVAFDSNPVSPDRIFEPFARLSDNPSILLQGMMENKASQSGQIIYSQSIGIAFGDKNPAQTKHLYQSISSATVEENSYFFGINPIIHKSNGNNGQLSCVPFGKKKKITTCFRGGDPFWLSARSVYVGAAEKLKDGRWQVHEYSDNRPTYCSPLNYRKSGTVHLGTSFSAPTSAGVEADMTWRHGRINGAPTDIKNKPAHMAKRYDRKNYFPYGVSHEDIILALQLTAEKKIINQFNDNVISYNRTNGAGIHLSDRCGAGVIQADKADGLLQKMVATAKNKKAKPTVFENIKIPVSTMLPKVNYSGKFTGGREYVYKITIPENGYISKPFILLDFKRHQKGGAVLISPRGTESVLRIGLNGNTDDDSFWGEYWRKGETLTLVTTAPLPRDGTHAFLRMTSPDSVFAYTARHWKQMQDPVFYSKTASQPPKKSKPDGYPSVYPAKKPLPR